MKSILEQACQAQENLKKHGVLTPLVRSKALGDALSCDLWFKTEQFQRTGSFKFRGALTKFASIEHDQTLVTASSGNHGLACAMAAQLLGKDLTVFLPQNVSPTKRKKIEALGVAVQIEGKESGETERIAMAYAKELASCEYVSPYNDLMIVSGQGTIGLELIEQIDKIDNIFIALGGGGLVSGVGSVMKALKPDVRIVGVSAANSRELDASLQAHKHVVVDHSDTLADGVAGGVDPASITLDLAQRVVDERIVCSEVEIANCLKLLAFDETMLLEGSAALALAGLVQKQEKFANQTNVVVLCGGNFDRNKIAPLLV